MQASQLTSPIFPACLNAASVGQHPHAVTDVAARAWTAAAAETAAPWWEVAVSLGNDGGGEGAGDGRRVG